VAGYIVKPVDFAEFLQAVRILDLYWGLSELPSCQRLAGSDHSSVASGLS